MTVTGTQLRDDGIERVLEPNQEWRGWYRAVLLDWFAGREEGFRFTGETMRAAAIERGLDQPSHFNAWGGAAAGVLRVWLREHKIYVAGLVPATRASRHANSIRQYEKIVARRYRFADAQNQMELIV